MNTQSTKTIYAAELDIRRGWNLPFAASPHSTVNEKFGIGNITPPSSGYPTLKYLTIGRKGHGNVIGEGDDTLTDTKYHAGNHPCLFEHIPFIMVPTTNDLTPQERDKFRICVVETYGGIDYYCYYAYVFPVGTPIVETRVVEFHNGAIVSDTLYVPSAGDMNPSPVDISSVDINVSEGKHFITQGVVRVTLDAKMISDIVAACITKYGNIRYATISEIGLVGGFDVTVTSSAGGITRTYTELRCGQIQTHVPTEQKLQNMPNSVTIDCALANDIPKPPVLL